MRNDVFSFLRNMDFRNAQKLRILIALISFRVIIFLKASL